MSVNFRTGRRVGVTAEQDQEQAIEWLKRDYIEGRIDLDELDRRVAAVLAGEPDGYISPFGPPPRPPRPLSPEYL